MNTFQRVAKTLNKIVTPLLHAPVIGGRLSKSVAIISYTGRRSGRTFSTLVNYLWEGDGVLTIGVMMPDRKTWWRNFYPKSAPIAVNIGGAERTGIAVARRDGRGVRVEVTLDA